MREYARIRRIMQMLEVIWKDAPDLRLGQLLVGLVGVPSNGFDIWDVEDTVLERELRKQINVLKEESWCSKGQ